MGRLTRMLIKNISMLALGGALATVAKKQVDQFTYPDSEKYTCGPAELKNEIKHISVNWISGSVSVKTWQYDTIAFVEQASKEIETKDSLYYYLSGNKLYIQFCKSGNLMSTRNKKLTLCIPNNMILDSIQINTTSANVDLFDVVVDDVEINTVSGNIMGDIPSSDRVVAHSVSGNAEINVSSLGSIEIKTTSGDIGAYSDVLPSSIDLKSTSGEITVKLPAYAKFNPQVSTISGSVYSEYRYSEAQEKVSVKTNSGNINFIMK